MTTNKAFRVDEKIKGVIFNRKITVSVLIELDF
jgi:hypothetical protein